MRIWTDIEPLDLPEVPRIGHSILLQFGDHVHTAMVTGIEYLDDGRMRLRLELLEAQMLGAWPEDPPSTAGPVLVLPGLGGMTRDEFRAIRRRRRPEG